MVTLCCWLFLPATAQHADEGLNTGCRKRSGAYDGQARSGSVATSGPWQPLQRRRGLRLEGGCVVGPLKICRRLYAKGLLQLSQYADPRR